MPALPLLPCAICAVLLAKALLPAARSAEGATYQNNFESVAAGSAPAELTILAGDFKVVEEGGNRRLELPGSPLDTFGLLFGPAQEGERRASARFYGTKQGRKFPTFGISLGGVSGYRLQASPGKKALELYKGDAVQASAPFAWESGAWMTLTITVRKAGEGWAIEGQAISEGKPQGVRFETQEPVPAGRAGIWGSPYAGTPIAFDDLKLAGAESPAK